MTRTYELRRAYHSVVHTSADPIVPRRGAWRTGVSAIFDPAPGDGSYVAEVDAESVPAEVDKVQIVLALDAIGIDEAEVDRVFGLIPGAGKRKEARLRWKHTAKVRRGSEFVTLLAQIKGLSEAEVDDLFRTAITL